MEGINPKVLLISHFPLPYEGIGSWTTLYDYYLKTDSHVIDYIICPEPTEKYTDVEYAFVKASTVHKIKRKLGASKTYEQIFDALDTILEKENSIIIKIIDNAGLVLPLRAYLEEKHIAKQCYLQFYYHGFPPFFGNPRGRMFFAAIDEAILLTHASYKAHLDYYTDMPCAVSVLHNGVDSTLFFKPDDASKVELRSSLGVSQEQQVFLWVSQDRPKKGLDFILKVWKLFYKEHNHCVLWVVGAHRDIAIEGVVFFGKVPNHELPKYYQATDVYLYPTLCKEGFGLTLIEALKSGCYCIASANGGVPEVVDHGKLAALVTHPNYRSEWLDAMRVSVSLFHEKKLKQAYTIPDEIYGLKTWCAQLTKIIEDAKKTF